MAVTFAPACGEYPRMGEVSSRGEEYGMPADQAPVNGVNPDSVRRNHVSAQSDLTFEVDELRRELETFDSCPHSEASAAVLALVRAARRISHLARELAADPGAVSAARDEVSLAEVTGACLADEGRSVAAGDLEAALALIAKRLGPAAAGSDEGRVGRTLAAIANLRGSPGG
jgi:hypothetical protein